MWKIFLCISTVQPELLILMTECYVFQFLVFALFALHGNSRTVLFCILQVISVYVYKKSGWLSCKCFIYLSVPSNYGYLSEGGMLRPLFDFLVQAGKTGALTPPGITIDNM